jgi:hypothetical protein
MVGAGAMTWTSAGSYRDHGKDEFGRDLPEPGMVSGCLTRQCEACNQWIRADLDDCPACAVNGSREIKPVDRPDRL